MKYLVVVVMVVVVMVVAGCEGGEQTQVQNCADLPAFPGRCGWEDPYQNGTFKDMNLYDVCSYPSSLTASYYLCHLKGQ